MTFTRRLGAGIALALVLAAGIAWYVLRDGRPAPGPGPQGPGPYFVADFETGDISQWEAFDNNTNKTSLFEITEEVVRDGRYALKITLMPDEGASPRKDRAEFVQRLGGGHAFEGHERYYGFSVLVPETFKHAGHGFFFITQWHGMDTDVPPLYVIFDTEGLRVAGRRFGSIDLGPVKRGEWIDVVLRVLWSASDGELEVWRNAKQLARIRVPTLNDSHAAGFYRFGTYLKFGPYRGFDIDYPQAVYVDEYRIGASYEEVAPGGRH